MSMRKIFTLFAAVLLFAGTAFSFPYDPNPSEIDGTLSLGITGRGSDNLFPGNWTNTLRSLNVDAIRLNNYLIHEFSLVGGPGGTNDLKIWNTPSFKPEKMEEDRKSWAHLVANPGANVPADRGVSMYTTHDELVATVEALPRDNLTVVYLGEIPRGFPIPVLVFSKNKDRTPAALKATGKPLVWITALIHGGEWSGGESALAAAYDIANGRYPELLEKVNIIVIPRINADGAKAPIRETHDLVALQWTPNPEGRDLNRDNVLLDHHIIRAVRKIYLAYKPHFVVDMHERGNNTITANLTNYFGAKFDNDAGDIGSSGSTVLQVPKEIVSLRYKYLEPDLVQFGEKYSIYMGLYREGQDNYSSGMGTAYQAWNNYIPHPDDTIRGPYGPYSQMGHTGTWVTNRAFDPDAPYFIVPEASYNHRSSRQVTTMSGAIAQLFENKAGPTNVGNRGMWERRVATGYICILSTITTAANRGHEIVPQIEAMKQRWIEKGKVYDPNDKIPILTIPPLPTYWNEKIDQGDGLPHHRDYGYWIVDLGTTSTLPAASADNITGIKRYDMTKAIKSGADPVTGRSFDMGGRPHHWVTDNSGEGRYQPMKFEVVWQGWNLRERARPTAYIFEGPYAGEVASRMLMAGIEVKRLVKDTRVDVVGWSYFSVPSVNFRDSGTGGWGPNNRNVSFTPRNNRLFQKDTYVVFLGQLMNNLIPMYMEPDLPFSVANGIMLTYMSTALGGPSSGTLNARLVGMEMPIYRYLGNPDVLETYDMDFCLPLINKGAVPRFFGYHTQEEIAEIAVKAGTGSSKIKVYDYDIQVHARKGTHTTRPALVDGKFDMVLPTDENTKGYLILKKNGSYAELKPHSKMLGWNIATIVVADQNVPFTVDLDAAGRPVVSADGRAVPHALPAWDDLIGVRIIEISKNEIEKLFKELPKGAVTTANGIELTNMINRRGVILSDAMLDGWRIIDIDPRSGTNWRANLINGEIVVTFNGDAFNKVTVVTLQKIGSTETVDLEVMFSGEWDIREQIGCNAGIMALLALFVLMPLFARRRN